LGRRGVQRHGKTTDAEGPSGRGTHCRRTEADTRIRSRRGLSGKYLRDTGPTRAPEVLLSSCVLKSRRHSQTDCSGSCSCALISKEPPWAGGKLPGDRSSPVASSDHISVWARRASRGRFSPHLIQQCNLRLSLY
jgi:hypothetical protein